jgi:hypothetical protein
MYRYEVSEDNKRWFAITSWLNDNEYAILDWYKIFRDYPFYRVKYKENKIPKL